MKNIKTYTGNIATVDRLESSVNGNPRYAAMLVTTDGNQITFCTAVDSNYGYELPNYHHKGVLVEVEVGSHYRVDTLNSIKRIKDNS